MREYLSDVMKSRGCTLVSDKANLIVAPCGCGKTTYFINELVPEYKDKTVVYLVDTTNLKESLLEEYPDIFKELKNDYDLKTRKGIRIATYSQFGSWLIQEDVLNTLKIKANYNLGKDEYQLVKSILESIDLVVCDEAHNLIKYSKIGNNKFNKAKGIEVSEKDDVVNNYISERFNGCTYLVNHILSLQNKHGFMAVLMSATPDKISNHPLFEGKVHNVLDGYIPKGYTEAYKSSFKHWRNISVEDIVGKALIYTSQISSIKQIEEYFVELGFNAKGIWSVNSTTKMDKCREFVRHKAIREGSLGDLDILIINDAYETGWNLLDKDVQTVIINSSDKDVITQARGRCRHNITRLYYRQLEEDEAPLIIPNNYLDIPLTKEEKDSLVNELKVVNREGKVVKWTSIKNRLNREGLYTIKDTQIRINGKGTKVSIISKTDESVA